MKKLVQNPDLFDEAAKGAYTHGLEHIYAIETIDLKTVRPIKQEKEGKVERVQLSTAPLSPLQYELPLEDRFCSTIPSFVLQEPVSVLDLSLYAFKRLCKDGMVRLKELVERKEVLEGMGQGHIEEIEGKLRAYLEGKALERCAAISFSSWLRGLLAECDRKKAACLLERYELSHIVSLTRSEQMTVSQLSLESRELGCREVVETLRKNRPFFLQNLKRVVEVFIVPWTRGRLGLVTKSELAERVEMVAEDRESAMRVWQLFEEVYFEGQLIFEKLLYPLDLIEGDRGGDTLFCVDPFVRENYTAFIDEVLTYFYRPELAYPLHPLLTWVESSLASHWMGFPEGFAEKALRLSPRFRVRKENAGLVVRKCSDPPPRLDGLRRSLSADRSS